MNETDVREEVLVPLLSSLGYRTGTPYNISRELFLQYPKQSLGRINKAKDPVLRGRADYILTVNNKLSWVLEAKAPVPAIRPEDIEQARTYAVHPEVCAAYFVLCNGHEIRVFDSLSSHGAPEILSIQYHELGSRFPEIVDILGPDAIERQIALRESKRGRPLGLALGSTARVASGFIKYFENGKPDVIDANMQTFVKGGVVERDQSGCIVMHLEAEAPLPWMQEINKHVGFYGFDLHSEKGVLPIDSDDPIEFQGSMTFIIPEGFQIPKAENSEAWNLSYDWECAITVVAFGILENCCLQGVWYGQMEVSPTTLPIRQLSGNFSVNLI